MTKSSPKQTPLSYFAPSPSSFRDINKINVSEQTVQSAAERYRLNKEVTIFASAGYRATDTVSLHFTRPSPALWSQRNRDFLKYGKALSQTHMPRFDYEVGPTPLPSDIDNCLRLYAAFTILIAPVKRIQDAETEQLKRMQSAAALMITDLYPDIVLAHARILSGIPDRFCRFGVCRVRRET